MSQAKRRKKQMRGSTLNGFLLLCLGMVLGSVLTTMYAGYRSGDGNAIGSGLRDFVANKTAVVASSESSSAENSPKPDSSKKVNVQFHERLADDEVVAARVEPERVSAAQKVIAAVTNAKPKKPVIVEVDTTQNRTESTGTRVAQLQVGSFSKRADAERMKAEIALQGFAANIESGQVEGREMFRVRLGPYSVKDGTLNQVREMLADNGFQSLEVGGTRPGQ